MNKDLEDIVLTFPRTHSRSDAVRMLEAYKKDRPEMYQQWIYKETHPTDDPANVLKDVQLDAIYYLKERCEYTDFGALASAWATMRNVLLDRLHGRESEPEGEQ